MRITTRPPGANSTSSDTGYKVIWSSTVETPDQLWDPLSPLLPLPRLRLRRDRVNQMSRV
ncbi:hypothetical protein GCM10010140_04020 [Streptosporangium pseudovulgare]|uniref:Uncharacterized protein n=1 Tax=Streptosporangium pseudovulgare TaxID=35765 RepID=A0ABQ2QHC6_9ACTN|nr:hypothetical protein GCM10010140_04020 [Streptosporangium pseudovulgare]